MKFVEIVLATPQRSSFPRKLAELEKQKGARTFAPLFCPEKWVQLTLT